MRSCHRQLHSLFMGALLLGTPTLLHAQTPLASFVVPLPAGTTSLPTVTEWSQQILANANSIWTESNAATRDRQLQLWAEQTPEQLAYVTRILQKNEDGQSVKAIIALKELFGLMKRVTWQPADQTHIQRIVSSWSVIVPQLIKKIGSSELSAAQRRQLEQALVDLALLSRDQVLGSPIARNSWQSQVAGIGQLTRHPKISVRLVALSVLEAIGPDANAASQVVQKSLRDADQYVRWSAVRTLNAIGMDQDALQAVARLKNDGDANVRQIATLVVAGSQSQLANNDNAKAVSTKAPEALSQPASLKNTQAATPISTSKSSESIPPPGITLNESKPAESPSKPIMKPAELPTTLPTVPLQVPEMKAPPASDPAPLFGPPPTARTTQRARSSASPLQLTGSTTPPVQEHRTNNASMWIPRLRQGTAAQQVLAVRELAKLGEGAADAVPVLAELLLKADVTVRREIPLALMKIGKPARVANSVLERSLQDADTDVKVNAARALLELAD